MQWMRRGARLGVLVLGLSIAPVRAADDVPVLESWDAVYLGSAKIGHYHTFVEKLKDNGRDLLRVRWDMALTFKRQDDEVTVRQMYGTIETPGGQVLRLDTRTQASNQTEMRAHGDVIKNKMVLTFEGAGNSQRRTIDWGPEVRGPYAAEQSLARNPMKVGESRSIKMYIPEPNKIYDITLKAIAMEEVLLGDGKRPLLRVDQVTSLDGQHKPEFDVTMWVDSGGQVLKSFMDNMGGITTFRTTREAATAPAEGAKLNLILTSIIRIARPIPKPETTRDIVYRVGLKDSDPKEVFPADRRQVLRPDGANKTILLEVRTAGPDEGTEGPESVDAEFIRPNALITSEDPKVVELAAKATAGVSAPWEKAQHIQEWVAKNLKNKNFSVAFAPAAEVARDLSGDCTEHSVLAAAMYRAQGIPARVAVGLVYAEPLGGFGFHMWNEVYVNRRWVALDSAFEQSSVDAVHIKLADTSLDGVSPYEAFLPVVRVMGKMTLVPLEIR